MNSMLKLEELIDHNIKKLSKRYPFLTHVDFTFKDGGLGTRQTQIRTRLFNKLYVVEEVCLTQKSSVRKAFRKLAYILDKRNKKKRYKSLPHQEAA